MKAIIKRVLPNTFLSKIRQILSLTNVIRIQLLRIISKSKVLSSIYYVFNKSFHREHQAVINGLISYYEKEENYFLIRRNIHRIEKGLLMKPRRNIFATSYIEKTVIAFEHIKKDSIDDNELKWFFDVLTEYFKSVGDDPQINKAKVRFNKIKLNDFKKFDSSKSIPYKRLIEDKPVIDLHEFMKLAKYRRSVRWYTQKPVPRDIVDNAVSIAALSPSACNRLPYEFKIFDQKSKVEVISNMAMGTTGYSHNIPGIVAVIGKLNAYHDERDRHLIYIDASLAAMSFVYALEVQGVSTCIINWPDIESKEKKITSTLKLSKGERVIMLISYGYPDPEGLVAFSQKKSVDLVRDYNISNSTINKKSL